MLDGEPQLLPAIDYLWEWFQDLHGTREGGFGPGPLTHTEIYCWASLNHIELSPWELKMIKVIDRAYFRYQAEKEKKP